MAKEIQPIQLSDWIPTTEAVPPLSEMVKLLVYCVDPTTKQNWFEINDGFRVDATTFETLDDSTDDGETSPITYCYTADMIDNLPSHDIDGAGFVLLIVAWMPLPKFILPEKTKFLNRVKGEITPIYTDDKLDKWKDPYLILNDIRSFESKNKRLTYPLWENDYLVVVPHKNKNKIGIFIEDRYGNKKGWDMVPYNASDAEIIDKLRKIVSIFYYNWQENPYV